MIAIINVRFRQIRCSVYELCERPRAGFCRESIAAANSDNAKQVLGLCSRGLNDSIMTTEALVVPVKLRRNKNCFGSNSRGAIHVRTVTDCSNTAKKKNLQNCD
jgi:hypothetical protein